MANEIIQGDSGTVLSLTIQDDAQVVDLTSATVEVAIKFKATGILKQATITDAVNGLCEITLDEVDIPHEGVYSFQATVKFTDGKKFSSNIERFTVLKKLNYTPNVGGGNSDIGGSTTNGNIVVNGIDIKVYDDTAVRSDINSLKQSKHTHSNLDSLERLGVNSNSKLTIDGIELVTSGTGGSTVSESTTNGNILVNGTEVKVYDDQSVRDEISVINNLDIIKRLGINEQGQLTIDGVVYEGNPPPIDTTAPNNVTNLSTSNLTSDSVTLNWTASTSTDVSGYEIYNGSTLLGTVNGISYSVSGLTANTAYIFTVKAKDASNNIAPGVSVNVTTSSVADTTPPNPVTNLATGAVTSNSIPVSWTLSSSSDVANYEIAYATDGTNYTVSSSVVNASSTTYTVTGLTASTNYIIRVVAIDGAGNRSTAVTVSASTSASADTIAPVLTITPTATFSDSQTVTMSTNETADIWFTTDGSDPLSSSTRTKYLSLLTFSITTTLKAYAIDVVGNASPIQSVTYTKQGIAVTGATLDLTSITLEEGQTLQLTATISPVNADNKSVTWLSSDETIATVDNNGLVSTLSSGSVDITVTTIDGGFTASCYISVIAAVVGFDINNLSGDAYSNPQHITFDQTVNFSGYEYSDFVHPSVLYFENGWNDYKYWMGVNPYPATQGAYENPYLFCSNDGDNWTTPVGLTQPIYPLESGVGNNSDSHIFMDYDGVTMHYLNRGAFPDTDVNGSFIEIFSTQDGVTFTPRKRIITPTLGHPDYVSPSVCKVNGKYYMFAIDTKDTFHIAVLEASDPTGTWTEINRISNGDLGELWHLEVQYLNQEFIVIANNVLSGGTKYTGGNLMLGKFYSVVDAIVEGRNTALISVPTTDQYAYEIVNGTSRLWNAAIYKSSFVMKNQEEFEVFIGFKGDGLAGSGTPWRVSRVQCHKIPQTLDLSGYTEVASYADNSSFTIVPGKSTYVDHQNYVVDFTLNTLTNSRPSAYADSTNELANFYVEDTHLVSELWNIVGGTKIKRLSYGIKVNDRITMMLDEKYQLYINGRLVYEHPNNPVILDNLGTAFGDKNGTVSMSNIKVYKKDKYIYSAAKADAYKAEILNEYASYPDNFTLVDEFNRVDGSVGVSDNGVTYEIVGSPLISSNSLKPGAKDTNAVLVPVDGNYSILFRLSGQLNQMFGVYLKYNDITNWIKFTLKDGTRVKELYVNSMEAGVETEGRYKNHDNFNKWANWRLDVINDRVHVYCDSVYMTSIPIPNKTFANKVGFTAGYAGTMFDYVIIKKLL